MDSGLALKQEVGHEAAIYGRADHRVPEGRGIGCSDEGAVSLGTEWRLSSPKQTFANPDLDAVSMSAFGQKQSFAYRAYACILTVNQCLLTAEAV